MLETRDDGSDLLCSLALVLVAVVALMGSTGAWLGAGEPGRRELAVRWGREQRTQGVQVAFVRGDSGEEIARSVVVAGVSRPLPGEVVELLDGGDPNLERVDVVVLDPEVVASPLAFAAGAGAGEEAVLAVWPASALRASLSDGSPGEPGLSSLDGAEVLLWPADGSGSPEAVFRTRCPVASSDMTCRLPAGDWDASVIAPGRAPVSRWGVALTEGAETDLGEILLEPAATLVGSVVVHSPRVPDLTVHATVRLTPARVLDIPVGDERRRRLRVLQQVVHPGRDGTFVIANVPVETLLVEAIVDGVGQSEIRRVEVKAPLLLRMAPLEVEMTVQAVLRTGTAATEDGVTLRAEIAALGTAGGGERLGGSVELSPSGVTELPAMPAGEYMLAILADGEAPVFRDVVRLDPLNPVIDISLDRIPVDGRVTLDDEPLAGASVELAGPNGEEISRTSDDAGRFSLVAPREGRWHVSVEAERPFVRRIGMEVDIEAGRPLVIALERTGIRGRVMDATRQSVGASSVLLVGGDSQVHRLATGEAGDFEVLGLPEGEYMLQGFSTTGSTSLEMLSLEAGEMSELELRLETVQLSVRGRVETSEGQPVALASGLVFSRNADGQPASLQGARVLTDAEGRFVARLPAEAAVYRVVLRAQGHDLFVSGDRWVSPDPLAEDLLVLAPAWGGVVDLVWPASSGVGMLFLMVGDAAVPVALASEGGEERLTTGPSGSQRETVIRDVPPGRLGLCRGSFVQYLHVLSGAATAGSLHCGEAHLAPGGRVRLELEE